jgi:hypothetical protein
MVKTFNTIVKYHTVTSRVVKRRVAKSSEPDSRRPPSVGFRIAGTTSPASAFCNHDHRARTVDALQREGEPPA